MLGKGGAVLGLAAAAVLTAGGVGAALAAQPATTPVPHAWTALHVVPVLDVPPSTTTTTTLPLARPGPSRAGTGTSAGESQGVTITVVVTH